MQPAVFPAQPFDGYALLDSGAGEKLERFGDLILARPDPQALWPKLRPDEVWRAADLYFVRESDRGGRWERGTSARARSLGRAPQWLVPLRGARVWIRPTPFKHVGLFPEQAPNWTWIERLRGELARERPTLLNLFAYTGAASLLAARSGFSVTHVDASKTSLAWARENAAASSLAPSAVRFVLDDAPAFARREVRRGARYDGILLDPPHYGRGPKGEKWQFEEHVGPLLDACARLLGERAFLVLSSYASGCSPLALANLLGELPTGRVEAGELVLPEQAGSRCLPCGFCARWSRGLDRA
jgi:23S rRNA (cytosine1962-C5)-methyltransferase